VRVGGCGEIVGGGVVLADGAIVGLASDLVWFINVEIGWGGFGG